MKYIALFILIASQIAKAEILTSVTATVSSAHGMLIVYGEEVLLADTFQQAAKPSQIFSSRNSNFLPQVIGQGLAGIAQHPKLDQMAVSDVNASQVYLLNSENKIIKTIKVQNPWNARWSPSGQNMFVVSYVGKVFKIDRQSKTTEVVSGLDAPFDLAITSENSFWISEQGASGQGKVCLYKLNAKKADKQLCNQGVQLENPEGLWPLADGGVLVVDTELGNLVQIDKNGNSKIIEKDLGVAIMVQLVSEDQWVVYTNNRKQGPELIFGRF